MSKTTSYITWTLAERRAIEAAADAAGLDVAGFVQAAVLRAAGLPPPGWAHILTADGRALEVGLDGLRVNVNGVTLGFTVEREQEPGGAQSIESGVEVEFGRKGAGRLPRVKGQG